MMKPTICSWAVTDMLSIFDQYELAKFLALASAVPSIRHTTNGLTIEDVLFLFSLEIDAS